MLMENWAVHTGCMSFCLLFAATAELMLLLMVVSLFDRGRQSAVGGAHFSA